MSERTPNTPTPYTEQKTILASSPLYEWIPTAETNQTMGIPEFAIRPNRPYQNPNNKREEIYNHIYDTLQEHPHRWFSPSIIAEEIGSTKQWAHYVLNSKPLKHLTPTPSGFSDVLIVKEQQTPQMKQILRNQVYDLIDRHYSIERIQEELGVPVSWIEEVFHSEDQHEDGVREFTDLFVKEVVASLRKDAGLGEKDISHIINSMFPEQTESHVRHILRSLREKDPAYRIRNQRGTFRGNKALEDQVTTLIARGLSNTEIYEQLIVQLGPVSFNTIAGFIEYLQTARAEETSEGSTLRKQKQKDAISQKMTRYHKNRKSLGSQEEITQRDE